MSASPSPASSPSLARLRRRLPELMLRDQRRLRRRLDGLRVVSDPVAQAAQVDALAAEIAAAEARIEQRRGGVPKITYPASLPITDRKDDILAAIRDHQVVIVAGETGSGKTTQLPKICLELGRGVRGMIGHTQPRRLAARTVAERIAEELDSPLGEAIGYQVRFTDHAGAGTLVKLMTDGILLAEIQQDRMLYRYDTLIIDEAHERSLNIDFILGYLRQLLPRRPDLKLIITSATIDPQRFAAHFAPADGTGQHTGETGQATGGTGQHTGGTGQAAGRGTPPVLEVSGRTYPVEVRYRPLVEPGQAGAGGDETADPADEITTDLVRDQIQAICDAVEELSAQGPGDILVFLSGEREIRDTADALGRLNLRTTEVVPLFARLSTAEQHRVFQPHTGRRIVLATNVAETSLTVPGIRYVIDPGTARISRYSHRLKVQRLPIEPVSQASANQRKGRCGRTSDGICIRLYSEEDFTARPEFTDPEIVRTNLASVILQMTSLGLGDVAAFPFIDPPDRRNITDGINLLHELGAIDPAQTDPRRRLTPLGRRLAQLPIDPRLARMVLAAGENGCLPEVLVIAAALSIQDPRERPLERQQAADTAHARFADPESDFLAYLNLWNYLTERQRALSSNAFRRLCRTEFLNFLRVREWQDLHGQLRQVVRGLGLGQVAGGAVGAPAGDAGTGAERSPADSQRVHVSLLAGLLSHLGLRDPDKQDYLGARGARFSVFPGSVLFRKSPRWVMAAELVETSRLWGRIAARVEPEWAEPLAGHLVKRSYSEPHWEKKAAAVLAYEKVTLYGVPLVTARKINYGRIDPQLCRELFIRHALVEGDWQTHHQFFHANRQLLDEVEELEARARRRDILVDEQTLFDFYDQRVGAEVVSGRHFDSWWKRARRDRPQLLDFTRDMLINSGRAGLSEADYPDRWSVDGCQPLRLSYEFDPGTVTDGVTVHVPLTMLDRVDRDDFDWQVPGLREELVTALLRSLPKNLRRNFVPVPDYTRALLERIGSGPTGAGASSSAATGSGSSAGTGATGTGATGTGAAPGGRAATGGIRLLEALERELRRLTGVVVPRDAWQLDRIPAHLRVTYQVTDDAGRVLDQDKDLVELRRRMRGTLRAAIAASAPQIERTGLRDWTIGELPRSFEHQRAGFVVTAYPALADEGDGVAVRLFDGVAEQQASMWAGTRRLISLALPAPVRMIQGRLSNQVKLALAHNPHGGVGALLDDCLAAALDKLMVEAGGPAWDEAGFVRLRDGVRGGAVDALVDTVRRVEPVLSAAHALAPRLRATSDPALLSALTDVRAQLAELLYPGFVTATGWWRLPDLRRYLAAIERRLDRLPANARRDREQTQTVQQVWQEFQQLRAERAAAGRPVSRELLEIRWMIEELRVGMFAQGLGTAYPISDKRIYRAIDDLGPVA